jgi:hypothetical protein
LQEHGRAPLNTNWKIAGRFFSGNTAKVVNARVGGLAGRSGNTKKLPIVLLRVVARASSWLTYDRDSLEYSSDDRVRQECGR